MNKFGIYNYGYIDVSMTVHQYDPMYIDLYKRDKESSYINDLEATDEVEIDDTFSIKGYNTDDRYAYLLIPRVDGIEIKGSLSENDDDVYINSELISFESNYEEATYVVYFVDKYVEHEGEDEHDEEEEDEPYDDRGKGSSDYIMKTFSSEDDADLYLKNEAPKYPKMIGKRKAYK